MTQARTPAGSAAGAGSGEYLPTGDPQIPTAITWPDYAAPVNKMRDLEETYEYDATTSADFVWRIMAEAAGTIAALNYANGAVAADGTNGWELQFLNKTNSDDVLAYFGIGSGTEAAKATDVDTAVAANASSQILCTDTSRFNKGDVIMVTADRDGTTISGQLQLVISYESEGR